MPFHSVSLGDIEIISIQAQPDREVEAAEFFPTADQAQLVKAFEREPQFFGETPNLLRFTQNICLVRTPTALVLIDTGIPIGSPNSRLSAGLEEAGISPSDIDLVVLTHRDLDHVGGTVLEGKPAYPIGRYVIGRSEYDSFSSDTANFPTYIGPLMAGGLLDVVADDAEVSPGIRFWLTPGHRSGAASVLVGTVAVLLADVWHSACQVTHPEWSIKFDSDPEMAAETRQSVVERAERENLLVGVPHTPFFGLGRVGRRDGVGVWDSVV